MNRTEAFAHFLSALPKGFSEAVATEAFNVAWKAGFEAGASQEMAA